MIAVGEGMTRSTWHGDPPIEIYSPDPQSKPVKTHDEMEIELKGEIVIH
jgi:hypothetical protein